MRRDIQDVKACIAMCCCRYYFLKDLHPAAGGARYLETPNWLKRGLLRAGIHNVNVQDVRMQHPSDARFRAFAGRGRRLND